jgi:hypothetical protein
MGPWHPISIAPNTAPDADLISLIVPQQTL